jgi:acetyltransferase
MTHDDLTLQPRYPKQARLRDGTPVVVRAIGPEDAQREQAFVRALSPESRYFRFLNTLRELTPEMLEEFTHPDPAREVALIALVGAPRAEQQVGVARCVKSGAGGSAEFAIAVADAWQGKGLGTLLMRELMSAARATGVKRLEGWVLASNHAMLELMLALGFEVHSAPEDARMRHVVKAI